MRVALQLFFFAGTLALFWWLGNPHELRNSRLRKMLLSLPFLAALIWIAPQGISHAGITLVACIVILSFIWMSNISWRFAGAFTAIFSSDATSATGINPEYRFAKNHRRDGEYEEAIAATAHELEKDPRNFEGLMLMAGIYQDTQLPQNAIIHLDVILNNPDASESQKEVARAERTKCEQLQKHLEATGALKKK